MFKSELLEPILSTSGPTARNCSNRNSWSPFNRLLSPMPQNVPKRKSWNPFCRLLSPMPGNIQIGTPGTHFVDFWAQCQKMLKSEFLKPILSTSGPNARKCLNRNSWKQFCRLLGSMTENAQIGTPGAHFVDFWARCQKILKSGLLELSMPNVRKSLNRKSWNPFS